MDNNLSPSLAQSLQPLFPESQIVALRGKFAVSITDVEWMNVLSAEGGWATITAERRLKTRPHERLALDRSRIVFFFLTGSWLKYSVPEIAWRLIRLIPLMAKQAAIADSGLFDLPVNASSKLRSHRH